MKPSRRPQPAAIDEALLGYEAATPHLTPPALPAPRTSQSPKSAARRSVRGVVAAAFARLATPG
jgi:hypothetical protein